MVRRVLSVVIAGLLMTAGPVWAQSPAARPVIEAIEQNNLTSLKLALMGGESANQRDDEGRPAIVAAAYLNRYTLMDFLIEQGASLNITYRKTRETAVMVAAAQGNVEALEVLIEAGADLNKEDRNGESALIKAVRNGHLTITRVLVEAGADLNQTDYTGRSALVHAEESREVGIFNYLSQKGATH